MIKYLIIITWELYCDINIILPHEDLENNTNKCQKTKKIVVFFVRNAIIITYK